MQRTLKAVSKLEPAAGSSEENKQMKREFSALASKVNRLKYRIKEDREMRSSEMTSVMESDMVRE